MSENWTKHFPDTLECYSAVFAKQILIYTVKWQ